MARRYQTATGQVKETGARRYQVASTQVKETSAAFTPAWAVKATVVIQPGARTA